MQREGSEVVSLHHFATRLSSEGDWRQDVTGLWPHPISRGRWFVRPLFLSGCGDVAAGGGEGAGSKSVLRLLCDNGVGGDGLGPLFLACFPAAGLAKAGAAVCPASDQPATPIRDCADRLRLRLVDEDGRDAAASLLGTGCVLGFELFRLAGP